MGIAHVFLLVAASCAVADAPPGETDGAKIDFYLSSMLAERQKISSGEFVVSGTNSAAFAKTPKFDYSGRLLIYCAFDETRLRMDNREPSVVAEVPLTHPIKMVPGRMERMYLRTPERSVTWIQHNGNNNITIGKPDSGLYGHFLSFDVRSLGFVPWKRLSSKSQHHRYNLETTIEALTRLAREKSVDTSDPRYVQLVFLTDQGTRLEETRYWLSPDQGFAPVRLETRVRNSRDKGWQVSERADTSWQQTDGVWLPTMFEITMGDESGELKLVWKIHWRSVNKPIDDARFDWQDFGAPETVPVYDRLSDPPVMIRPRPAE